MAEIKQEEKKSRRGKNRLRSGHQGEKQIKSLAYIFVRRVLSFTSDQKSLDRSALRDCFSGVLNTRQEIATHGEVNIISDCTSGSREKTEIKTTLTGRQTTDFACNGTSRVLFDGADRRSHISGGAGKCYEGNTSLCVWS